MQLEFVKLVDAEFDDFVESQSTGSFLQSVAMGKRRATSGWQTHLVGVKDAAGNIQAAALLNSHTVFLGYSDFECLQGPVMDYDSTEVVHFFFESLKDYLKKNKAISFLFNPKLLLNHRDIDANLVSDNYDGEKYVRKLVSLGFTHLDNQEVDQNPLFLRWYFAKDLTGLTTPEELMASFDQQATRSVKKNIKNKVSVRTLPADELDPFFAVMEHTGQRRGFDYRDEQYYRTLAEFFGATNIEFNVVELDIVQYGQGIEKQLAQDQAALVKAKLAAEQAEPENKKAANKLEAAQQAVAAGESRLTELESLRQVGETVVLAAAVFITFAGERVFLAGGSYDQYSSFYAAYALHWDSMQKAISSGVPRYNFYGTKGDFSGNPDQQGVYKFKRGFGGCVEEQIGYFRFEPRPLLTKLRSLASKLRRG